MHLNRLQIDALPGIDRGFTFEAPGEGVNVITGPNAIGKSSLARALGYLLRGPQNDDPPEIVLAAEFQSGDTHWTVHRIGSQVRWLRNGESASPPAMPGADQIGLYRLSVENLLATDSRDSDIAREIRLSLRGGFDLEEPRIELSARFAQGEERELRAAGTRLVAVEREYAELKRGEDLLPGLTKRIDDAKYAGEEAGRLELALSLQDAVVELDECKRGLDDFHPTMARLQGDELDTLSDLDEEKDRLKRKLERSNGSLEKNRQALMRSGLERARPTPAEMGTAENLLRKLAAKLVAWESSRQSVAQAQAALNEVIGRFEGKGEPPRLDRASLRRVQDVAEPLLKARGWRDQLQQRIEWSGASPEDFEIDRRRDGAEALRDWLTVDARGPGRAGTRGATAMRAASWLALLAAGFAAVSAWVLEVLAPMLGAVVAMASVILGLVIQYRRPSSGDSARKAAEHRFRKSGLAPPPEWARDAVEEHLRSVVESELQSLIRQREKASGIESLEMELEKTRKELDALENQRSALADEVGFDPAMPLVAYERFIGHCVDLDRARTDLAKQHAECGSLAEQIDGIAQTVGRFLDEWQLGDTPAQKQGAQANPPSATEPGREALSEMLRSSFDDLRDRLEGANELRSSVESGKAESESLQRQIAGVTDGINALYNRADLEPGDRVALVGRMERLDDWRDALKARERATGSERQLRRQLEASPELIELADRSAREELQTLLQGAEVRANEYTSLVERRSEIRKSLRDAGSDGKLETALADETRAREALTDKLDEALLHGATEVLLDDVEKAFHSEHEPEVLRRAKTLFAEATRHEFSLELRPDDSFMARDNSQGTWKALGELSSGTRMQMLLALRLAWTEAQEQGGESLPLFLDEALTTSDESRFKVIAESLERLAEAEGRQIFYLAARRHEAALWQQVTGRQPAAVDLAEVRFPPASRAAEDYRVKLPPKSPAPENRSPEEYAALLGVEKLDPRRSPDSLHPFHLLRDDLELLHDLIEQWRVVSLGQLEALLDSRAAPVAVPDDATRNRLVRRFKMIRSWTGLWRQGRGRPVDRGVLEQSGAVSKTFIDAASDLLNEREGDGRAFIETLRNGRLKGFRTSKIDELESWLAGEGFTDETPILETQDRRRLTLQMLAPDAEADANDINKVVGWLEGSL